ACAGQAPSPPAQQTAPTAAPAQATAAPAPAQAVPQELVVGAPSDTYRLDPPERATLGMYPTNAGIYESLVRVTSDYQVEPLLATEWEFVEPNTWRFKLRQGVTFHDGQPFTAEAVRVTMERIAKAGGGTPGIGPESVKIVDDYTVEITPSRPNRRLIQQITHPNYSIIAPGSDPTTKPVGTGPFTFVEYVKGERIVVERNPQYWGEPAKLEKITFRFIPDDNTRALALKAGEVQLIYDAPRELTADLSATPGLRVATSPVGAYEALYVNAHGQPPHDIGGDPLVREAIALAIDKQSIVRDVWRGNAEVNSSMIPVRILGEAASMVKGPPFDPERAKQLLEQAGWVDGDGDGIREKDGRRLSLVMVVGFPTPEIHRPMPEVVQAQLKAVGVELTIETTPDTASYEDRLKAGTGDLWAEIGNQNDANPCFLPDLLFYSKVPPGEESGDYARLFAPGAAFDAAIETCRSAVSTEEVTKAAAEAMRIIIDEEHIVIPIAGIFRIYALQDTVQGFEPHASRTNQRWDSVFMAAGSS
ncbi:MAG TPA: ABC transporter substrate-binding protein, partial [Roseiflexaceae bacterium]|nr:ABC transporter substrate-binding protein [Roseiflexaceae bacterium]